MKKLMEDIASVFCPNCVGYDVAGEQCGRGRKVLECENATSPARYAITHIGKAVLSGEYPQFDRLLGVVAREHGLATFIEAIDGPLGKREDLVYIAVRREGP